ncbi:alpha-ketoacid dehydrogenase subunit beta [Candidatus Woesearchaeota archaeon]|nr:alpha-ketoacid dehydrogenase subunit beta [Candidatus Woesearchaeota archaeon]
MVREITYADAIKEAFDQLLESSPDTFVMGIGVKSPWYVGNSMKGIFDKYGEERIIDIPISENGITGITIGAAMAGMRPIMVHPRMDFMYLAMDQIINSASAANYMFGGKSNVPVTIRSIINRGGEQGAQHSQASQAMYMHIPGIKVVMPSTPYDAKGLLVSSVKDNNPVIYIDDRWLYNEKGDVPEEMYEVPIGKANIIREGKDLTIVATSYMVSQALVAAEELADKGIDIEIIDLRTIKPIDEDAIITSVKKTGKLLVVDAAWRHAGVAAEVSAIASEKAFSYLKQPIHRLTLPDCHAPASSVLEEVYYIRSDKIKEKIQEMIK